MISIFVFLALVLYCSGLLFFNERAYQLYLLRVIGPWREAIARHDFPVCDRWARIAQDFPLQDPGYILNPIRWITCWNWTPPKAPTS